MKRIKLLTPLLGLTAITGSMIPLVSCGNQTANVVLDATKCAAEQTTDANMTMNTYVFNVKNFDSDKEELSAEITNIQTTDDVSIEITSTSYKKEENKFYVYITTSKTEGTLNEGETVKFSILFKCLKKETQEVKWEKTIDSLVIKHTETSEVSQHFIDTDVNKVLTTNTTGDQTISLTFKLGDTGKWTNKDVTDMYNIANLSVSVYQSDLAKASKISIGKVTTEWNKTSIEGTDVYTSLTVNININIPEYIPESFTTYNLLFEYSSPEMLVKDTWKQTIGGFKINYNMHYSGNHSELACSRERHYYKNIDSDNEKANNYIVVRLLDDHAASYKESDFEVTTNNENITIGSDLVIYSLKDEIYHTLYYYLAIPYSIKDNQSKWYEPKDYFNVSFKISSKATGYEWSEIFKGFSFFNRTDYRTKSLVWYENDEFVYESDPIKTLSVSKINVIKDNFRTISPIDISYVVLSYANCDSINNIEFDINELNWEGSDISIKLPEGTTVGTYNISYTIMVVTVHCAYSYTLTVDTTVTA